MCERAHASGQRAVATVLKVGSTMGGLSVSSTIIKFAYDVGSGPLAKRVVVTGGVSRPEEADTVAIVYLPDAPQHATIVGNPGYFATFVAPLIALNVLWLGAAFAVVIEAVERLK